jgi:hypothetical protein
MSLALVASLVGLVPLLVDRGVTPLQQRVIHSILGTVTLILAFIQPILAFFRCAPGKKLGIFKKSMGARNRGGIGLSYRPARLHRLAEFIPWNQFRGPINI